MADEEYLDHRATHRPIYYGLPDYPKYLVREWPDGRCELIGIDRDNNIFIVKDITSEMGK